MGGQCISSDAALPGFGGGEGQRHGSEVDGLIHRLPHALKTALPGAEIRASERGCAQRTSAHRIACASRSPRIRAAGSSGEDLSTGEYAQVDFSTAARPGCDGVSGRAVQSRLDDGSRCADAPGRRGAGRQGVGAPDDRESGTARVPCVGDGVSCGRIHCENRCWIAADPPAGDASSQTRNTSNDKSVKVSTSYFKIEVSWRCGRGPPPSPHLQRTEGAVMEFGIFTIGDVTTDPTDGTTVTEHQRIKNTVEIAKKTEEVGLDVFATGQHHNPPFVAPANPPVLLSNIAAQTSTLELSTATTLITTTDPVRIAADYS